MTGTYTCTHPCQPLILCTHKHIHTSRGASFIALPGVLHDTHTHTSSYKLEICLMMTHTHTHVWLRCKTHISLSRLQERFSCMHAALHATGVVISSVCDESSQQRQSYCRLYCETSGCGAPVFQYCGLFCERFECGLAYVQRFSWYLVSMLSNYLLIPKYFNVCRNIISFNHDERLQKYIFLSPECFVLQFTLF